MAGEHKAIGTRAAMGCATVLVRGRVVATWKQKRRARWVDLEVQPLSGWRGEHLGGVEAEAEALAQHLGLPDARVRTQAIG